MGNKTYYNLVKEISPTFCLAKFHEATIWLYNSKISSCHHTPLLPTGTEPLNFFNTSFKRQQQDQMLLGNRPPECDYCWKLEDQGLTSDRELKSLNFKTSLTPKEYLDRNYNFRPKSLELAFQNTCNLACSYCSPTFSTEWINDIKNNGMYKDVNLDIRRHLSRGLEGNVSVDMNMFWEWFDDISKDLECIRITGGEPLLHEETFKTFEKITLVNPDIECVIHTNLCQKPLIIQRFIDTVNKLKNVRINISNESAGTIAEFIRDGMIYGEWLENVENLSRNTRAKLSISTTVTSLSLIGLDELFRDIINLRKKTNLDKPYISINFATYPAFQSLACLSLKERLFYLNKYTELFEEIKDNLLEPEKEAYPRLLSMLDPSLLDLRHAEYRNDAEIFFSQYTARRNKKINILSMLGKK